MGTDIHLIVEHNNGGANDWAFAPDAPGYNNRNYRAFAILADVRNGRGFAGCDTGDALQPVAAPRGLPPNFSNPVYDEDKDEYVDQWGKVVPWIGDHSFSWLLLSELLDYNWNRRVNNRGWVNMQQYETFKLNGEPSDGYCGGVSGRSVRHVTNDVANGVLEGTIHVPDGEFWYTPIQWSVSYKEAAPCLHAEFIPELSAWAQCAKLAPEQVRIVFGFDS